MLDALMARFTGADAPPCLVAPSFGDRLAGDLAAAAAHPQAGAAFAAAAEPDPAFWGTGGPDDWRSYLRPYTVVEGVLQIPVKGALLAGCSIALGSWCTGYGYIARAFARGVADANVRGIALLCDSYGGHVAECFDLADAIHAARGSKPIRAFAHEHAYSAAYCLASAADRIIISRTGGVGSIGVVTAHRDVSVAAAAAGVKVTFIHFGAHKVDGNPFEPLPKDVRERMQARIDELGGVFVATVARNRGLTPEAVKATEALTYTASDGIKAGLADAIGSLADAVSAFCAEVNSPEPEDESMISQADHDAAVASARAEGKAEGVTEGMSTALSRIAAITGDAKLKGRVSAAVDMAVRSPGMAAADVVAFVDAHVPVAAPAAAGGPTRLDVLVPDPNVAAGGGDESAAGDAMGLLAAAVDAQGGRPTR